MKAQSVNVVTPARKRRKRVFACLAALLGCLCAALIGEVFFRFLLAREKAQVIWEGTGFRWVDDSRWGWKLSQGEFRFATSEFDTTGLVNELFMNDGRAYAPEEDAEKTRLLILGDSHTAAVGVSAHETWGRVLEDRLGAQFEPRGFRSYNAAVAGYSLHQYLLRLIDQGPVVKPHYVVVGYSFATDLYDLLPPDRGGWAYGGDRARAYFDLDENGNLVERHWDSSAASESAAAPRTSRSLRRVLENFATFNYMRRSKVALAIGSRVTVRGQSLWPNMDVVVEKDVSEKHKYQWALTEALLSRINQEARRLDAQLIIVGIPYLPQIYDEIWDVTFGGRDKYSRTAAAERISSWCEQHDIPYVETLDAFTEAIDRNGQWLHHRKDAHPTVAGQALIADTIIASGLITPASTGRTPAPPHLQN